MTIEIRTAPTQPVAFRTATVARADIGARLGELLPAAFGDVQTAGGQPAGAPFVRYREMSDPMTIEAGVPIAAAVDLPAPTETGELAGGRHAVCVHVGPYDALPQSWERLTAWIEAQDEKAAGAGWESYLTDPGSEPDPAKWVTEITIPLA